MGSHCAPSILPISLSASVKEFGSPRFQEILATEIEDQSSDLPIEMLCRFGGHPKGDPQIGIIRWSIQRGTLHVFVPVYFDELIGSSCGDLPHEEPAAGEFDLMVALDTGQVSVKQDEVY